MSTAGSPGAVRAGSRAEISKQYLRFSGGEFQSMCQLAHAQCQERSSALSFSVARRLVDSDFTPPAARCTLRTAFGAPPDERDLHLETAARLLHRELALDCHDARELVGLDAP